MEHAYEEFGGRVTASQQVIRYNHTHVGSQDFETKFHNIVEASPMGIHLYKLKPDGRLIFTGANPAADTILGIDNEQFIGKTIEDAFPELKKTGIPEKYRQVCREGTPWHGEQVEYVDDKIRGAFEVHAFQTAPNMMATMFLDITQRRKAEETLIENENRYKKLYEESRRSEELYRSLLNSSADAIVIYNMDGRVNYLSPVFTQIFGWSFEELKGERIPFVPDTEKSETFAIIKEIVEEGSPCQGFETKRYTKDGKLLDISISASRYLDHKGRSAGILVILRDISERKRLESQLQQAQKMEAIGTLAGGIAHDFNNLMMGMLGNVSLMMIGMDESHRHYEKLKNIEKHVQSGTKLTSQILGYARRGQYEVKAIDLNGIVKETAETFARTKKEVRIHQDYQTDLFAIEVDQGQIEQILLNLYINAADAMPGGGDLFLKTMNLTHVGLKNKPYKANAGNYVLLQVKDTGLGMDSETADRIFEPFFTTKKMGRGTGLGLASVYGIIKGHNGYIDVESEEGQGTIFSIYLPATNKKIRNNHETPSSVEGNTGTIMLVDDEELVIDVGEQMLRGLGFNVVVARNGEEAIKIYKDMERKIDLVILDMVMPDISGGETYDDLKAMNPEIKVLLSSGYSIDGQAQKILERGCNGFLQKPFGLNQLSLKINEIIDKN